MRIAWNTQVARLTAFPLTRFDVAHFANIWAEIAGSPPEGDEARPREGSRRQWGTLADGRILEIVVQPARLDWHLAAAVTSDSSPPQLHAGAMPVVTEAFVGSVKGWLTQLAHPISRLGYGTIVISPVASREDGYSALNDLVPSLNLNLSSGFSDLLFQINRPRQQADLGNIAINRLMKWSVARIQTFALTAGGFAVNKLPPVEETFLRLELDINTVPPEVPEALAASELFPIFQKCVDLANEIAECGETP